MPLQRSACSVSCVAARRRRATTIGRRRFFRCREISRPDTTVHRSGSKALVHVRAMTDRPGRTTSWPERPAPRSPRFRRLRASAPSQPRPIRGVRIQANRGPRIEVLRIEVPNTSLPDTSIATGLEVPGLEVPDTSLRLEVPNTSLPRCQTPRYRLGRFEACESRRIEVPEWRCQTPRYRTPRYRPIPAPGPVLSVGCARARMVDSGDSRYRVEVA